MDTSKKIVWILSIAIILVIAIWIVLSLNNRSSNIDVTVDPAADAQVPTTSVEQEPLLDTPDTGDVIANPLEDAYVNPFE